MASCGPFWSEGTTLWPAAALSGQREQHCGQLRPFLVRGNNTVASCGPFWSEGTTLWPAGALFGQREQHYGQTAQRGKLS